MKAYTIYTLLRKLKKVSLTLLFILLCTLILALFTTCEDKNNIVSKPLARNNTRTHAFTIALSRNTINDAKVGTAINPIVITPSPSDVFFKCISAKLQEETGLRISGGIIQGTPTKSNFYNEAITKYSYEISCTSGSTSISANIETKVGLASPPSGETAIYYRPTTKEELKAIINAEKVTQKRAA